MFTKDDFEKKNILKIIYFHLHKANLLKKIFLNRIVKSYSTHWNILKHLSFLRNVSKSREFEAQLKKFSSTPFYQVFTKT